MTFNEWKETEEAKALGAEEIEKLEAVREMEGFDDPEALQDEAARWDFYPGKTLAEYAEERAGDFWPDLFAVLSSDIGQYISVDWEGLLEEDEINGFFYEASNGLLELAC